MNGATASASSVIPASSCSITNTISTVVMSGVPRRKQQRVHYGVHAPGVDRDAAHGIAHRMGAVRTERLSLHVREQVVRQCGRPCGGRRRVHCIVSTTSARLLNDEDQQAGQHDTDQQPFAGSPVQLDTAAASIGQRTAEGASPST